MSAHPESPELAQVSIIRHRNRSNGHRPIASARRAWAATVSILLALGIGILDTGTVMALDEVVLNNGRRYLGTIVTETPDAVVLSIDGGTVEFPRTAIVSPKSLGAAPSPQVAHDAVSFAAESLGPHPLPNIGSAISRLRDFPWATGIRQIPMLVTDQGQWQYLPGISFWAGEFCQLSIFGDPQRPAAIEVSLVNPPEDAWEEKQMLLEYVLGLVPSLAIDSRFDRLDLKRDSFAVGDLWFAVTSPDSIESPGRWAVLLMHELSVSPARATLTELQAISEPIADATIDPSRPRSWQRASWTPEDISLMRKTAGRPINDPTMSNRAWTALGGERVFVRAFIRDRGKYARSTTDWLSEFATVFSYSPSR